MLINTSRSAPLFITPSLLDVSASKARAFAVPQSPSPIVLNILFQSRSSGRVSAHFRAGSGRLDPVDAVVEGNTPITLRIDPPADPKQDDRVVIVLHVADSPQLVLELRRTQCVLESGLLGGPPDPVLPADTRAALLWYGWKRCARLVGIKRFGSGLSGSDVLVFRPLLAAPATDPALHDPEDFRSCAPPGHLGETWGAWLLVKSGALKNIRQEWARYEVFLRDRLTPFMARSEAFLQVVLLTAAEGKPVVFQETNQDATK